MPNVGEEHAGQRMPRPRRFAIPTAYQYDFDLPDIAEVWRRGSVIASWLLDLTAAALAANPELDHFAGRVSDSGEGRWTLEAAIDEGVPANVLSAALFSRFTSRGEADFQNRLLSAMRAEFGGHAEKSPPRDARDRKQQRRLFIDVLPDAAALARAAAERFVVAAERAIADHERFVVALSGGSTPRRMLRVARARAPRITGELVARARRVGRRAMRAAERIRRATIEWRARRCWITFRCPPKMFIACTARMIPRARRSRTKQCCASCFTRRTVLRAPIRSGASISRCSDSATTVTPHRSFRETRQLTNGSGG